MTVPTELDARFRAAAADSGLLDAAYDLTETPIGTLLVGATDRGLCKISFRPDPEAEREELARAFGPRVLRASKPLERHATLFALGMAGSPELAAFAQSEDPETLRGARWWLGQGTAIHDSAVVRPA